MTETAIHQALSESVVEVLEKMFFVEAIGDPPPEDAAPTPSVLVKLDFHGDPSGVFRMSLARTAAAVIAADFLGEDAESLSAGQVDEVAKELANMICGAVLSRIESRATFRLEPPGLNPVEDPFPAGVPGTLCTVETGNGILTAAIDMESRACPITERSAS